MLTIQAAFKLSKFKTVPVAEQASLGLTFSQTPDTSLFLVKSFQIYIGACTLIGSIMVKLSVSLNIMFGAYGLCYKQTIFIKGQFYKEQLENNHL